MKQKTIKTKDIGRFVRVLFMDVGAQDGIITNVDGPNDFRFLPLGSSDGEMHNNAAPAIALGKYVDGENSGLDK